MNSTTNLQDKLESNNILTASGSLDTTKELTLLHLSDGQILRVATAMLLSEASMLSKDTSPMSGESIQSDMHSIPIIEERLEIGKQLIVTGKVLLEKHLQQYRETLDVPLATRTFDIERVILNQAVEAAPAIRQEGNTTIYPLIEEQLVLTTKLILKEEVRVTQRDSEHRDNRTVTLHRETISITRSNP